jgi:hypothetical protein
MEARASVSIARVARAAACAVGLLLSAAAADGAERFDVAAWVDHFDFAGVLQDNRYLFDSETAEGCARILDHVQEVGATTILWRNCGGGTMRYQSRVDSHHNDGALDKRRVLGNRPVWDWVRYGDADPDLMRTAFRLCKERGLRPGVHWPFEETHWQIWTIGRFNLEHPQFWGRTADGRPWWGRCSLAHEEVIRHKLALVDELIDRGMEVLFIDFFRTGGWSPAYEYVEPVVKAYREQHGAEPPVDHRDPRWKRHVARYVTEFLRQVRGRLNASGRKIELAVGIPGIAPLATSDTLAFGADWRAWVDEGLIDTLVINTLHWDANDPMGSTRALGREVMQAVNGRCRVLWPVRAYDFSGYGMPSYRKALPQMTDAQVAAQLTEMAWEEGAAGISLECVDYNNYGPETRKAMRALVQGKCRLVREKR